MERTEEQKLTQEPIIVTFGGSKYEIKPLPIKYASPWRKKYIALMREISALAAVGSGEQDKFLDALSNILVDQPDKLVGLLFDYMPELNREDIESKASSAEILKALEEVITIESPFLGVAIRMTRIMQKNLV